MKILHTGDWHIGTFPGPERNGENVRFLDICRCLDALVGKATQECPDIIIVAGDIFHQAKVWSDRGLRENRTAINYIRLLSEIAPVVVLRGTPNHDSDQQFSNFENAFYADDSVHIITEPELRTVYTYFGETVQIAAVPGFDRGYYRAKNPGLSKEEENEVFTKALENIILGLKAECKPGVPAVLVAHFTIPGCNMESGQTQFFSQFEPVIYPSTLEAADFDLNCFGHIHRPQQLGECKNTFYSGGLSAMNFNDEGQERGFYIHDIENGSVSSTFHTLPTREFKTVRLENEDVENINKGVIGCLLGAEVGQKIVRVLYNCTDENNKAFNKASVEQALYSAGAFWVQEITPQKISITANRDNLSDENGPEENLRQYFEEKGYEPEKIAEIIEAARPIIAEATEKNKTHGNTGLFTPLKIEVKNYRNYREESFDYDGIQFCTINGENGAGKSSLFMDAMLDALYEEPREGDLTGWICNDPDVRSGAIQFTFRVGESVYRVTRTRQKSGKATLNISERVDGEWQDRSAEKFRDTQNIILETIGMDSLTFKACALIMQDQYGLFLQADKEARMNILGNILGLGIYEKMEELASAALTDRKREIRALQEKATDIEAGLPDSEELEALIADAEASVSELQKQADAKAAEIDSTKVRLNTKKEAAQRVARIQANIATLSSKRQAATANKTSQMLIANDAASVLLEEPAIKAGVEKYHALLEKEKALISAKDRRDDLESQKRKAAKEIFDLDREAADLDRKGVDISVKQQQTSAILFNENELTAYHAEYLKIEEKATEMREALPEYLALKETLNTSESNLTALENQIDVEKSTRKAEIKNLEQRVALLENSGCPIAEKASCRFLADAFEAKAMLPEKQKALGAYINKSFDLLEEAQIAVNAATRALSKAKYSPEAMAELERLLKAYEKSEKAYAELGQAKADYAEYEKQIVELEEKKNAISQKRTAANAEFEEISTKLEAAETDASCYDALVAEIAAARIWIDNERELPALRERLTTAQKRADELTEEINQIEAEIAEKNAELEHERATAEGAAELEKIVLDAEHIINFINGEIKAKSMKLGALQKQAEDAAANRETVKELQAKVEELGKLAAIDEALKRAFSQDGVPHNVIRSIIPIFEATATSILGQMSGGSMSVEFVTEKVLKSNNKKEVTTLDVVINDANTGRLPYMSRSGGERVKAALSVILALSEIKSTKAGVQLGFLFVDEPPFLDGQGVQAYVEALKTIQQRYSDLKIMAITHDETMKAMFPQNVNVVKTAEGSKVIYQ